MVCRKDETTRAFPFHETATKLEITVTDILLAFQSLTGCDCTCKIYSKNAALSS